MKIAIATDDGRTVSPHFGRASLYAVLTVEDGVIVAREIRSKSAPHLQAEAERDDRPETGAHGTDPASHGKHAAMLDAVTDCGYVIAGGMGRGAHEHIVAAGLRPIVTDLLHVDDAAIECDAGRIVDHQERLH